MTNTVAKTVSMAAPIEVVWGYLSEADKMREWMLAVDKSPAPGQRFTLSGEPQGDWDGRINCRVIEMDAPTRMVFTWNHNMIGCDTLVEITLAENSEGGTTLNLVHSGFEQVDGDMAAAIASHNDGWDMHLGSLQQKFE